MRSQPNRRLAVLTAVVLGLLTGCSGGMHMSSVPNVSAKAGVTTGGAQDIGLARNQVAAGRLPSPESFVVEGLLGEHDIALDSKDRQCDRAFCLQTATGLAPALDTGEPTAFTVLGFSSNIDLRSFQRAPLNVSVVVDRSGSMQGAKMAAAREALHKLVRQLGPEDRLSIIAFDHRVDMVLSSTSLRRAPSDLHERIDDIGAQGSTNIESALAAGYRQVARQRNAQRDDRVILITDARPNTGRTGADSFIELARRYGEQGIGLTVMGVGLDFGQKLTLAISQVPGANYFYLESAQKLSQIFDRDFDLLVTPVAWDFELLVEPSPGYRITAAYGVPSWTEKERGGAVRVHVPTLFLSRNRGAIVLRMEPTAGADFGSRRLGRSHLSYRLKRRATPITDHGDVRLESHVVPSYPQAGVQKAVALVNTALGLKRAVSLARTGDREGALATLSDVQHLLTESDLEKERRLARDLHNVISKMGVRESAERTEAPPEGRKSRQQPQWIR